MLNRSHMTGFTMLEVLISIVVIAFGLLGIAGLQAFAVKNNQSSAMRITASAMALDIVDRAHGNWRGVVQGGYNRPNRSDYTVSNVNSACSSANGCTSLEMAGNDVAEWGVIVAAALPNGQGIVCLDSTPNDGVDAANPACDGVGLDNYVVKVWWRDDRSASRNEARPQLFYWPFRP